jgi:hypothetical protein
VEKALTADRLGSRPCFFIGGAILEKPLRRDGAFTGDQENRVKNHDDR